ncbi:hypothetical protein Bca4012_071481 [Brassica carinata]
MPLGAGNGVSRRRWALSATLLFSFTIVFLISCSVLLLAMSRESSLTAAKLWSSGSNPVVPLSVCRQVQAFKRYTEPRFQPTSSSSSSPGRLESHKPLRVAPLHQTDGRSRSITSSVPSYFGIISLPSYRKVMLSSPPLIIDGASCPLRRSFAGDFVSFLPRARMTASPEVTTDYVWAWPICVFEPVSPRYWKSPRYVEERVIQRLRLASGGVSLSSCDFNRIYPSRITRSYLSFGKILPVGSPGLVILRSSSSVSLSLLSVCFSFLIGLSSCVAISTGSEDATETTSVVLVDEVWTSTSHHVTILQLSDFVVKAHSTHSSFVSNSLSSSVEDLSFLDYLCVKAVSRKVTLEKDKGTIPIRLHVREDPIKLSAYYWNDRNAMEFLDTFKGSYSVEPVYVDAERLCKNMTPREEYRKCSGGKGLIASKAVFVLSPVHCPDH